MEQCRQGKSAKWIRNLGKRIGSEGWARGSQFRTRRLLVDCLSCSRGESGSSRAGRGTDWERALWGLFPGHRTVNSELVRTRGIRLFNLNKALRWSLRMLTQCDFCPVL